MNNFFKTIKRNFVKAAAAVSAFVLAVCALSGCGQSSALLTEGMSYTPAENSQITKSEAGSALLEFSLNFMKKGLSYAEDENPVLSPASAYLALLLLACGSSGVTASELSDVLGIPDGNWTGYGNALKAMMNFESGDTLLKSADSAWFDDDENYVPKEDFLEAAGNELGADIYSCDLQSDETVSEINEWVKNATEEMITKLREKPYESDVRAVLLNALYFEAKWETQFEAAYTSKKDFLASDGSVVNCDFLADYECYRSYVKDEGLEGILLPYTDGNTAFLALRATDERTPAELLESLTAERLLELAKTEETVFMNFSMPKFDIDYRQELSDTFTAAGLKETMNGNADLSNMFEGDGASRMDVDAAQVVRVQVDEEGTKAAAVTEITVAETSAFHEEEPIELCLDSPFLYAILDTETGAVLFMGIMENPEG